MNVDRTGFVPAAACASIMGEPKIDEATVRSQLLCLPTIPVECFELVHNQQELDKLGAIHLNPSILDECKIFVFFNPTAKIWVLVLKGLSPRDFQDFNELMLEVISNLAKNNIIPQVTNGWDLPFTLWQIKHRSRDLRDTQEVVTKMNKAACNAVTIGDCRELLFDLCQNGIINTKDITTALTGVVKRSRISSIPKEEMLGATSLMDRLQRLDWKQELDSLSPEIALSVLKGISVLDEIEEINKLRSHRHLHHQTRRTPSDVSFQAAAAAPRMGEPKNDEVTAPSNQALGTPEGVIAQQPIVADLFHTERSSEKENKTNKPQNSSCIIL